MGRFRRQHQLPTAPENVRAVVGNEEIPLEMAYLGLDEDDIHVWQATVPVRLAGRGFSVRVDTLPAHTSIGVTFEGATFEAP